MSTKVIMRRNSGGFEPADEFQWDKLKGMKIGFGEEVEVTVKRPRNLQHHRKYFALIAATFEMQDEFDSLEVWRIICQTGAGYVDYVQGKDGQMVAIPKSISFAKMDQTQFDRLYSDVLNFICGRYIHGDPEDIEMVLRFA